MNDRQTDFGETVIDVPALIAEARGFIEGSDSARSALIRDLADELEKAHASTDSERAIVAKVRAYADDRFRYGRQNRTVGSMRIASDLYAILGLPATELPEPADEHEVVPTSPTGRIDSPVTCESCGRALFFGESGWWEHVPSKSEPRAVPQGLCAKCGWHLSSHARSMYGRDCPGGQSPAARSGQLSLLRAAAVAEPHPPLSLVEDPMRAPFRNVRAIAEQGGAQ